MYNYSKLLRERVEKILNDLITHFYAHSYGSYQRDNKEIDRNYFIRHSIETVLRIRYKRMIDALVIHYFAKHNPKLAKNWAKYIEDEMLHGHMFARDIEKLSGITLEEIYKEYQPLFSTQLLNGYFYFTLEHEGPMAAITSAYFLEYTTRMTQPLWLDNLEKIFGKDNLAGARVHLNHDIQDNHRDFVWNVLFSLVNTKKEEERLFEHLSRIYGLFSAYFLEIYQTMIEKKGNKVASNLPISLVKELNEVYHKSEGR